MPNRIIKESICTSETIHQLARDQEVFFYRLIVSCDDYGRMDGRPRILRTRCFPLELDTIRDRDILAWLQRLQEVGLLELYEVGGHPYLHLITWNRHQQIRAKRPKYPAPDEGKALPNGIGYHMVADDSTCPRNPIQSNPIMSERPEDKPPAHPRPNGLHTPETEAFRLAAVLRERILGHNPKAKVPQTAHGSFQAWCQHVNSLLLDGHEPAEVEAVINWCQGDTFWHQHVLSARGLREKYDKLYLGWREASKPKTGLDQRNGASRPIPPAERTRAFDPARDF